MEVYMAVKFIIGDFKPREDDILISDFDSSCIQKNKLDEGKRVVIYAESAGLKKAEVEYIMKCSTADVIVVCQSKRAMQGARNHKNAKIEYSEGYSEPASPFDVAKLIVTCKDRNYVHEFLKYNKIAMYMVVKSLISNFMYFKIESNVAVVGWLDQNLYRVNPEFLWAYSARKFKPETHINYMRWNWPKKK